MRKLTIGVATLVLSGGMLAGAPAASAGDDDLTLTGTVTDFERNHRGDGARERGPGEGDGFTVHYDLSDHGGDADSAGSGVTRCVLTEADREEHEFTARCFKVLKLDDGQIRAAGTVTRDDIKDGEVSLPIIGGTGDYEDAEGDVITEVGEPGGHRRGGHNGHGGHGREREFKLTVDLD